jgi:hypothetical protein
LNNRAAQRVLQLDGQFDDDEESLMELRLYFVVIIVILSVLFLIAPKMILFRIAVLRKLKWNGLANFHENNFDQLVIITRVLFALFIAILVLLIVLG